MRLAIYGAGSLGTVLGAFLSEKEVQVDLISRNKGHIEALRKQGAIITGTREFTQNVTALLPEEMKGLYDIIFLLTKTLDNTKVAQFLSPHLAPSGMLCTLQNGLPEPLLIDILGKERVSGCTVGWGATLIDDGQVEITSALDTFSFNLGLPVPGQKEKLQEIASILSLMGQVTIEKNFIGARWSKLLINAAFSGVSTLLGTTYGGTVSNKKSRRAAQLVMKETIDTAKAAGIVIEPVQGKDIVKLFDYHNPVKHWVSFSLIPIALKKHKALKPSMLQDIEKGKPCEVDGINGVLSAEGRRAGVSTPVNDLVVDIIHRIERGELTPSWDNLSLFEPLLKQEKS